MAIDLIAHLKTSPFVLAPMAGITDCPFRIFMRELGAGIVVSELISATGIQFGSQKTLDMMRIHERERPVGLQLFGEDPEAMGKGAQKAEEFGADFVDLNFGCPVPKVVKKGGGSAMLKDLKSLDLMLGVVKKSVRIPVTIKIRTGWDQNTRNASEVCQIAYDNGITWVAIHGRTRAQGYEGNADWDFIKEVKSKAKLPILGNGDITSAELGLHRLKESGCDGVLIGRGALKNPYIFQQCNFLLSLEKNRHDLRRDTGERLGAALGQKSDLNSLIRRLYPLLVEYCNDRIVQIQIKKFAAWFASGYPNSGQFRKRLFLVQDTSELLGVVESYFEEIQLRQDSQKDTSGEAFLMGGHG